MEYFLLKKIYLNVIVLCSNLLVRGLSKILINCTFTFLLKRVFQTTYCTLKSACFVTVLQSDLKVHKIFGITSCQANTTWKHIIYSKNNTFLIMHQKWYWRCNIKPYSKKYAQNYHKSELDFLGTLLQNFDCCFEKFLKFNGFWLF